MRRSARSPPWSEVRRPERLSGVGRVEARECPTAANCASTYAVKDAEEDRDDEKDGGKKEKALSQLNHGVLLLRLGRMSAPVWQLARNQRSEQACHRLGRSRRF